MTEKNSQSIGTFTRRLTVTGQGRTYYVTLPKEIIKALVLCRASFLKFSFSLRLEELSFKNLSDKVLGWKKGERKRVYNDGQKVIIEDA